MATHVRDLAASGAIVITRAARDRLRGDFAPIFEDKGESRVPGIAHPVRSFQIAPVDECGVARRRLRARTILVGGLAIGVELGRDAGNFPTSFRAYITYAAD